jgi:uncharacterized membrane protein SpoIIM required for sporulation
VSDLIKSYRFREEREADWATLALVLSKAEAGGVKALSSEEMLALPRLYRQAVSSLSVARTISLDQNVISYLESLCTRAYFFVYGARTSMGERMLAFFRHDWPAAVRAAMWPTLLSALFLFGGAALGFFLVMQDTQWFWTIHGGGMFDDGRNPEATAEYLRSTIYTETSEFADEDGGLAAFASFLFNNNAQIALLAFALGFAFGLPTALLLTVNGIMIGSLYAVFWQKGLGYGFTGWLMIHGVTELFAIVLAGAAGFLIGGAVAFPGALTRLASAREAGQKAATIAMGCVIMLIVAAILEGFGRQLINSDSVRYTIAAISAVIWFGYFYLPRREDRL